MTTMTTETVHPDWCTRQDCDDSGDGWTVHRAETITIAADTASSERTSTEVRTIGSTDAEGNIPDADLFIVVGGDYLSVRQARHLVAAVQRAIATIEEPEPADPAAVQALRSMVEASGFAIEGVHDGMTRVEVRRVSVDLAAKMVENDKS